MESRIESTRCRGIAGGIAAVLTTRARWQVDSDSSASTLKLAPEIDGEGVIGKTGVEGIKTGKVVVVLLLLESVCGRAGSMLVAD